MPYDLIELAWAAGFYDGEGSASLYGPGSKQSQRKYVRLSVGQKDRRPLDRFLAAVQVGRIYERVMNRQPFFVWTCQSLTDTAVAGNVLWPYLSEPKREQLAAKQAEAAASRLLQPLSKV